MDRLIAGLNPRLSVGIRVKHPNRDPDELSHALGLVPTVNQLAGAPRRTPRGTPLEGRYRESYAWYRVRIGEDSLSSVWAVGHFLEQKAAVLARWQEEGGYVGCAIGAGGAHEPVFLPADLLGLLSRLGVCLELSLYEVEQEYGVEPKNDLGSR